MNYPASLNFLSTRDGADDHARHIGWSAASCPGTRIVLGGFSQGTSVISMLAGVPPVGELVGTFGLRKLDIADRQRRKGPNGTSAPKSRASSERVSAREVQQCKRVATSIGDDLIARAVVQRSIEGVGEQRASAVVTQVMGGQQRQTTQLVAELCGWQIPVLRVPRRGGGPQRR